MSRARVEGTKEMMAAFDRLGAGAKRHGAKAIRATAEKIRADAVRSIIQGQKSGVVYEDVFATIGGRVVPVGKRQGNNLSAAHQASAPGEAPANDTGGLAGSGKATSRGMNGEVRFTAKQAFWLENGTLRIAPRPFLAPAVEANAQFLIDQLTGALDKATREFDR